MEDEEGKRGELGRVSIFVFSHAESLRTILHRIQLVNSQLLIQLSVVLEERFHERDAVWEENATKRRERSQLLAALSSLPTR